MTLVLRYNKLKDICALSQIKERERDIGGGTYDQIKKICAIIVFPFYTDHRCTAALFKKA